jgi:hypothetical protein
MQVKYTDGDEEQFRGTMRELCKELEEAMDHDDVDSVTIHRLPSIFPPIDTFKRFEDGRYKRAPKRKEVRRRK